MAIPNFYCAKYSGGGTLLSIDEWNRRFNSAILQGLNEEELTRVLEEQECIEQCFNCTAIVGETRLKNSKL